ncbi:ABC transporter ATP-binding protein [Desmospora activa]|uniref:ABC-2 type transport system ATP-binding protein n=1 Tax=Desmospora activa DSM 45169 TaxID=1121389 RepID=A0A2T4ZCP6_9BACL|nr:ABC transporter ATP-binding protein [Desmospora activa]PTM59668.1 ABC-2 type transport system ATP-binding protein [Desmospora activa DSM 45169]
MEKVLHVQALTKQYRNGRGVEDVCFDVYKGDVYGLFGPNGAGKTTVLKVITGLCIADKGTVQLFGHRIRDQFETAMERVSAVIETAIAYDYMSGAENLRLVSRFYPDLPKGRIDEVLEQVGLTSYQYEKVSQYSLGMKQRLALAASLLSHPRLLIWDEPTNGLDIEGMVEVRRLIQRLAREQEITFLISSHMIHEMEQICNRVGFIYKGKLFRQGNLKELLNDHQTLEQIYLNEIQGIKEGNPDASYLRQSVE